MRLLDFARHFPHKIEMHICVTSNELSLLDEFKQTRAKIVISPIKRPYLEVGKVMKLVAYTKNAEIGIVNSFDLKGLIISIFTKAMLGNKVRVVHHFIDLLHNYSSRMQFILWELLKFTDCVICNSQAVRKQVIGCRNLKSRVAVIPNGVDIGYYKPNGKREEDRFRLGFDGDQFVLGTLANFRQEKNYPFLISSFRELSTIYPRLRLMCVGGGPLLESTKDQVKIYGLENKVTFTGYSDDVRQYLGMMDAFVLCSLREGFPNAVLQAMSMGLPVISSEVGEIAQIIESGSSGIVFYPNDQRQFVTAVRSVLDDIELRRSMSEAGRRLVEEHFSLHRMIERYVDFYLMC